MVNIDKIKARAKEKGISITHLCAAVSQGAYYLNDVKKRNGDISDERLLVIADMLDTTIAYLRDETDDPATKKPLTETDEELDKNIVVVRGRDGSYSKRRLTDEQIAMLKTMIDSLPDAPDDL